MKHEIKDEFQSKIILSNLDLSNHDFSESFLRGLFTTPLVEELAIINKDKNIQKINIYLGFMEIEVLEGKGKEFYKNLHLTIKKRIVDVWASFGKTKPLYQFNRIKCDKENHAKYLILFLSPKLSNSIFNFNLITNRNQLISNLLELLLKAHLLEKANTSNPINFDVVSGKVFLEPQIKKKKTEDDNDDENEFSKETSIKKKNSVTVFSFNLAFNNNDYMLKSSIQHERYLLEECNDGLDTYDDFCSLDNYKYLRRLDAREQARPFFNFKNYESLNYSRFIAQARLYKTIIEMCEKYKISYQKTYFSPQYLYCNFPEMKSDIKSINLYIKLDEFNNYSQYLQSLDIQQDFDDFLSYFKNELGVQLNVKLNYNLDDVLKTKNEPNLFLMFGDSYDDNYVFFKDQELGRSAVETFVDKEMFKLSTNEFLDFIKDFDSYSQIKLYNLFANNKGLSPIVSQGLIVNNMKLKSYKYENEIIDGKKIKNKIISIDSGFKNIAIKIVNELSIKADLYVKRKFKFQTDFLGLTPVTPINTVMILNRYQKKHFKTYSCVKLIKMEDGSFSVDSFQILFNEDIKSLNLEIDVYSEFDKSDNLLLIDEQFLIKVKDNDFMPVLIMEEGRFNVPNKDLVMTVDDMRVLGKSTGTSVSKSAKPGENVCYPYNTLAASSLVNEKDKTMKGNHSAMLDFSNDELKIFMNLKTQAVKETIDKNSRLESLEISTLKDFSFEKDIWTNNEQLMNFYLSSIPFNYMSVNAITKKSLLTKLADIVLLN